MTPGLRRTRRGDEIAIIEARQKSIGRVKYDAGPLRARKIVDRLLAEEAAGA